MKTKRGKEREREAKTKKATQKKKAKDGQRKIEVYLLQRSTYLEMTGTNPHF